MKQHNNRIKSIRSFLKGVGSGFDLFSPPKPYPFKSDAEAIRSDWEAVGQDMWKAIRHFERKKDGIHVD